MPEFTNEQIERAKSLLPQGAAAETDAERFKLFAIVALGYIFQMGADTQDERETAQRALARFGRTVVKLLLDVVCNIGEYKFSHCRDSPKTRINAVEAIVLIAETEGATDVLDELDDTIVRAVAITREIGVAALNHQLCRLLGFRASLGSEPAVTEFLEHVRAQADVPARKAAAETLATMWAPYAKELISATPATSDAATS